MDSCVTVRKRKHLKLKGALTQCGLKSACIQISQQEVLHFRDKFSGSTIPQNSIEGYICLREKLGSLKKIGSLFPLAVCEAKALFPKEDTSY